MLATALGGNATYVITVDKAFQDAGSYKGVEIVSPRRFAAVLAGKGGGDV